MALGDYLPPPPKGPPSGPSGLETPGCQFPVMLPICAFFFNNSFPESPSKSVLDSFYRKVLGDTFSSIFRLFTTRGDFFFWVRRPHFDPIYDPPHCHRNACFGKRPGPRVDRLAIFYGCTFTYNLFTDGLHLLCDSRIVVSPKSNLCGTLGSFLLQQHGTEKLIQPLPSFATV